MLDGGSAARHFLYTKGHGGGHHTGEKRILGIIFKVSSAERVSVDVHAGRQPQGHFKQCHFMADHFTDFFDQIHIPGLGEQSAHGNSGTVLMICDSFLFPLFCEESSFQGLQETAGFDFSVDYLVRLFETDTGRAVCENDACHIPGIHSSCGDSLCGSSRHGLPCGAEFALTGIHITCGEVNQLVKGQTLCDLSGFAREYIRDIGILDYFGQDFRGFQFHNREFFCQSMPCSFFCLHAGGIRLQLLQLLLFLTDMFALNHHSILIQLQ